MSKRRGLIWSMYTASWTAMLLLPGQATEALASINELLQSRKFIVAKSLHILGYVTLALLSGWWRVPLRYRWLLMFFLMVHATVTELLQLLIGRGGRLEDVGLDHLGILLGVGLTWKWWTSDDSGP